MADTFKDLGRCGAVKALYECCGFSMSDIPYFECNGGYPTTSSVLLLEGIDFDLTFFPLKHLGYKAVLQATGELFSVMAAPKVAKVVVGVSAKLDFPQVKEIWQGMCQAAKEFGYADIALELVPSLTGLSITVAATGVCSSGQASARPAAKTMDLICLSNNAGAAFLGEQILQRTKDMSDKERTKKLEQYRQLVGAYLKPELSPYILNALSEADIVPSFGYFCKESLRDTLMRLKEDSGLGVKIYVDKLPFAGGSIDAAKELNVDPLQAALKGGDDNCILFTIPIGSHEIFRHDFQSWDVIGHLAKPEVGAVIVSPDGLEHEI